MDKEMLLRRALRSDIEILCELNVHVQSLHHEQMPWLFKPASRGQSVREFFEKLFDAPPNNFFLAQQSDGPAGYVFFEVIHNPETALTHAVSSIFVHHLSVKPSHRKSGVCRALMGAVNRAAADLGIDIVQLSFWIFNDEARHFYERLGFQPQTEKWWKRRL